MKTYTLPQIKDIYNDYRNNYLTTTRMADDYGTTPRTLQRMFNKINIHYRISENIKDAVLIVYKQVTESTLESIDYIQIHKEEISKHKQIVQTKYPEHIVNRLGRQ
jgi:hypothetical protein